MERKKQILIIIYLIVGILGISIAYAALSATPALTINYVKQSPRTWDVRFDGSSITPTVLGTGDAGRSCGNATVSNTSITVADTTLSKPGDGCIYEIVIDNEGDLDAIFNNSQYPNSFTAPSGQTCTSASNGTVRTCGNITYKLTKDSAGNTPLNTQSITVSRNDTGYLIDHSTKIYLVVLYNGSQPASTASTQSGAKFTLTAVQG